jgi:cytidine deaminase
MKKDKKVKKLIKMASRARKKAYAPYSKFKVGAALEAENGKIYTGSNIENASYGVTICAERVALVKAVSEGVKKLKRIAIVAGSIKPCPPCGICRQALYEFAPKMEIIMANLKGDMTSENISKLLAHAFRVNGR